MGDSRRLRRLETVTESATASAIPAQNDTITNGNGVPAATVDDTTSARASSTSGCECLWTAPDILSKVFLYILSVGTSSGVAFITARRGSPAIGYVKDQPGIS